MKERKNGFFMFVTSCIPGCGQMYQGYMNRGISLTLLFFGICVLMVFLNFEALLFLLFPVWLYAYFDSYNLRSRVENGAPEDDAFLFGLGNTDGEKLSTLLRKRHSLMGWLLVGTGIYMLYDRIVHRFASFLWQYEHLNWLYELLVYDIPRFAVSLVVIWLGLWFIRGPKAVPAEEEIPAFTPPAAPEAPDAQEEPHGAE
jgi:TM2 domain-containing membrane protein YozV